MKVKDIFIYPIKSIGGIRVEKASCTELGLQFDRRMMLTDDLGNFVTQREYPKLATISCEFSEGGFVFYDKNDVENRIFLSHQCALDSPKKVKVWNHIFEASEVRDFASDWFSDYVNADLSLFKMTSTSERYKSLVKSPGRTKVSMADGYPYLFLSDSSLKDLNSKLDSAVTIDRFRANVIIEDCNPYEEEEIDKFSIGASNFRMIKPCARCSMITINQKTAEKLVEPLKTLSLYKKKGNKVYFGMNAISKNGGEIKVGDTIVKN